MKKNNRKIVLDLETTGMNFTGCFYKNHRIIEIGAIEIINNNITGNNFHSYVYPNRLIDDTAFKIHGISNDFLIGQPKFSEISKEFLEYINTSDLIIHNAKFDIGFINYELSMLNLDIKNVSKRCNVIDTLVMARRIFPGKKNTLDALCSRYKINTRNRNVHSAIYDAKLLSKVYMFMTNFQESLPFLNNKSTNNYHKKEVYYSKYMQTKVIFATDYENIIHKKYLKYMLKKTGKCIWVEK
ncbi:MAG: DNA polymerase III subunit epsilon [Buchnera aphidicola (Floraphis choui)]